MNLNKIPVFEIIKYNINENVFLVFSIPTKMDQDI